MNKARRVICEGCSGSGWRPLRPAEVDTLSAVMPAWETTTAIRKRIGGRRVSATALINRLNHLHALGIVARRPLNYRTLEWRLK